MRYNDYNRGTKTGKTYKYADCFIGWSGVQWIAYAPFCRPTSLNVIARANGIKPIRDVFFNMKINKEGPWAKPSES